MSGLIESNPPASLPYASEFFTGVRASEARLTIANHIGAIRPIIDAQVAATQSGTDTDRPLLFVADLHAFTDQDPRDIVANRLSLLESYLALGVDPDKTDIFVQTQIADEVSRVTWGLGRLMTLAQVQRVPTLKDKVKDPLRASLSLALYPVFMASDIILQRPRRVPTGLDQQSHLEVTRDLIDKINSHAGLPLLPTPQGTVNPVNVLSLRGPGKMSKTDAPGAIFLDETPEEIARKIRRAKSASQVGVASTELENLVLIGRSLTPDPGLAAEFDALYDEHLAGEEVASAIKQRLTTAVTAFVGEYQTRHAAIVKDFRQKPDRLANMLERGHARAAREANITLAALDEYGITLPNYK